MEYKLCILAAGMGERMMPLTKNINKGLLPINNKAAISHIIEKHSEKTEIIIAVNYEKEKLKEYLECCYPKRKIIFVEVPKIKGSNTGPGFSLICCREFLNKPFILSTVDTLFYEECPKPDKNWMGICKVNKPENYCTTKFEEESSNIYSLFDKDNNGSEWAFIGIAGIKDFELFFSSLCKDKTEINGEIQVSNGFKGLLPYELKAKKLTWLDVGNINGYHQANKLLSKGNESFDFSKTNEYIYFINNNVIKFFADSKIVSNRIIRKDHLKGLTPEINKKYKHFYCYEMIKGRVLYDQKDQKIVSRLLKWLKKELWIPAKINKEAKAEFVNSCRKFYYTKTISRLKQYYSRFNQVDQTSIINGVNINTVKNLLGSIDFDWLSEGSPTNFHGDLQFDNILLTSEKEFKLLDWRHDFSGHLEYGDMYYDLAKLNGGLYISYKAIKENKFQFELSKNKINLQMYEDDYLLDAKKIFNKFIYDNNLDLKKIEILTGLIFLNMSPMHNAPFSHFVYYFGKKHINNWISNINSYE